MFSGVSGTQFSLGSTKKSYCVRYAYNRCPFSALTCPFSHNKDDTSLCHNWKNGVCPKNNLCNFRHYYLERDAAVPPRRPLVEVNSSTVYSSPLVVKVKTLTEKHRRVEVDLETGKRRSWIETENKELIDITGEASPAPPPNRKLQDGKRKEEEMAAAKKKLEDEVAQEEMQKKKELEMREKTRKKKNDGQCSVCNRQFRGVKGLSMHLQRSKCGDEVHNEDEDSIIALSDDSIL